MGATSPCYNPRDARWFVESPDSILERPLWACGFLLGIRGKPEPALEALRGWTQQSRSGWAIRITYPIPRHRTQTIRWQLEAP
jgi:hypothetical protein